MQRNKPSSNSGHNSRLIRLFVQRAGIEGATTGEQTISALIARQQRKHRSARTAEQRIQVFLKNRNISSVEAIQDLQCDGALEPLGPTYGAGFKVLLRRQTSSERVRFTIAHEICHTYFYELVPEMKFASHDTDLSEERLCDLGAAELLMPARLLQKSAGPMNVCLESLKCLATEYSVSLIAMFLRLRSLRLWNCAVSEWHRMVNGTFVLANFYGGKSRPWQWEDNSILANAWQSSKAVFGNTFIKYEDENCDRHFCPIRFEVRRFGERVLALWGQQIQPPLQKYPLFDFGQSQLQRKVLSA